jgi:four helix bundle protein
VGEWIRGFRDLKVYKRSFELAMVLFELSKEFPAAETYSLTDQMRRSSRAVCANLAEAWAKRRYPAHFVSKLTDCQAEAMETQNWLILASRCGYVPREQVEGLIQDYDGVIASFATMINQAEEWKEN